MKNDKPMNMTTMGGDNKVAAGFTATAAAADAVVG